MRKKGRKKGEKAAPPRQPAPSALSPEKREEPDFDGIEQHEAQREQLQVALADLEESRNRYAELYDNAPVGYLTLSGRGTICEINLTAASLLGRNCERLRGSVLGAFVYDRSGIKKLMDHLRSCRNREKEVRTIIAMKAPDGTGPLPVELLSRSLENEADRYHTVIVDRSQQEKAEAALRDARDAAQMAASAKDDFIAALSHELRTPLNPVLLIASENSTNPALSAETRADFSVIAKNVALEARLIDDMLDLTRIIRGQVSLERQPSDVHAILQDALSNVAPDLALKHISVTKEIGECPFAVFGDSVRLQQIFWNILRNAAKFTPEHGQIAISSRMIDDGSRVVLKFSDSGIGMKKDELGHIFDAFALGSHARAKSRHQFGGLGLGLTISKKLVELHSGTICASSEGPMRGATFTVVLPLMKQKLAKRVEATESSGTREEKKPSSRGRLLLVEDHEPTRKTLQRILAARNFEVESAASVAAAWALVNGAEFDLLVSDIGLPDGDGYVLMRELQERFGLRGIALTGYGMEDDIKLSKEAGFSIHLTKPIHSKTLDAALLSMGL